jgi:hypothetical protein
MVTLVEWGALQCSTNGANPGVGLLSTSNRSNNLALSNNSLHVLSEASNNPTELVYKYLKNA